jgi:hypothetical protein
MLATERKDMYPLQFMEKKNTEPSTPLTLAEAARQMNWGAGDRSLNQDPKTDRVFITTTGTTDPNWEPGEEDWKRLAELFRG